MKIKPSLIMSFVLGLVFAATAQAATPHPEDELFLVDVFVLNPTNGAIMVTALPFPREVPFDFCFATLASPQLTCYQPVGQSTNDYKGTQIIETIYAPVELIDSKGNTHPSLKRSN